jgi:hypothetical protein
MDGGKQKIWFIRSHLLNLLLSQNALIILSTLLDWNLPCASCFLITYQPKSVPGFGTSVLVSGMIQGPLSTMMYFTHLNKCTPVIASADATYND